MKPVDNKSSITLLQYYLHNLYNTLEQRILVTVKSKDISIRVYFALDHKIIILLF